MKEKIIIILGILMAFLVPNNVFAQENVVINNISIDDRSSTILISTPEHDDNNITSNITFNKIDDFINFNLELKNNISKKLRIIKIEDNNSNENISINYEYDENKTFKLNETNNIKVKMLYKKQLYNVDEIILDNLQITITFEDEDGGTTQIDINNPRTRDNIILYGIVFLLSFASLVIIAIKKKKIKALVIGLVVTFVVGIPLAILALNSITSKITYSNIHIIGEYQYFDVTTVNNNGSPNSDLNLRYGTLIGDIAEPTKNGYTFDGWYDEGGNKLPSNTPITSDMTITARYNVITYSITFDLDGGVQAPGNPTQYNIESNITLSEPTRLGYRFLGWTGSNGSTPNTVVTINGLTGDLNYKAEWEEYRAYMVSLRNTGSSALASIEGSVKTIKFVTLTQDQIDSKNAEATANGYFQAVLTDTSKTGEVVYAWGVPNASNPSLYDVTIGSIAKQITFPDDSSWMFNTLKNNLTSVDFGTSVDTSSTSNFASMFNGCNKLEQLTGFNNLDTSSLRWMDWIFQNCAKLENIDMSNFDTSRVTTMWGLFEGCTSLTSVDVSSFDTSSVTVMNQMFLNCTSIEEIDLSNFVTSNVTDFRFMFQNATSLRDLNVGNLTFTAVTDNENGRQMFSEMPTDAEIIVKSCAEVQWINDHLSKERDYPERWENENFIIKNGEACSAIINSAYMVNLYSSPISTIEANVKAVRIRFLAQRYIDEQIEEAENDGLWHADLTDPSKTDLIHVYGWAERDSVDPSLYNVTIAAQATKLYLPEDSSFMFNNMRYNLTSVLFEDNVNTSNVTNMASFFYGCSNLYSFNGLNYFDTSNVESFAYMFAGITSPTLDISGFDTSKATTFDSMFNSSAIETLTVGENFKTSNATSLYGMFTNSNISNTFFTTFDTSKVTNFGYMFASSNFPTINLSNYNTVNATNMEYMFANSTATSINVSSFNTEKVTDMTDMFYNTSLTGALDLSHFRTPALENMVGMFALSHFSSINVSNFDTSHVTDMKDIFYHTEATSITGLDSFNTASVTTMEGMFYDSNATTIDISGFDVTSLTNGLRVFLNSTATTIKIPAFNFAAMNQETMFSNMSSSARVVVPNCTIADYILDTMSLDNKPHGWSYSNVNTESSTCSISASQNIQTLRLYSNDILTLPNKETSTLATVKLNDSDKLLYANVKLQGTSSLNYPKKNYTITFYEDDLQEEKLALEVNQAWGSQSKYCFKANWIDSTQARNIVSARLAAEMQAKYGLFNNTPNHGLIDGFFVEIYINDEYHGLYTMNIPKSEWMFNMDKNNPNHIVVVGEDPNRLSATTFERLAESEDDWEIEVGPHSTPEEVSQTLTKLNRLIGFVKDSTNAEFRAHIEEYMNLDALMNYYVFMALSNGVDNMNKNMLLVTYDGTIWYPSLYDLDSTWGLYFDGTGTYSVTNKVTDFGGGSSLLFKKLVECFPEELQERYIELRSTVLSDDNIIDKFEEFLGTATDEQWTREHTKWTTIPGMEYDINQIRQHVNDRGQYMDSVMTQLYVEPHNYGTGIVYNLETPYTGGTYKFLNTGVNLYKENVTDQKYTIFLKYKTNGTAGYVISNSTEANGFRVGNVSDDHYTTFFAGNNQYEALYKHDGGEYTTVVLTIDGDTYTFYVLDPGAATQLDVRTITSATTIPVENNLIVGAFHPEEGYFIGEVKNLTVYDRVFTTDEIVTLLGGA